MTITTFDDVVDAAESLSPEAQVDLLNLLKLRIAERGRQRVVADVAEARAEFERGEAKFMTVDEILREVE